MTVGQPASYDAGIRRKPLGGSHDAEMRSLSDSYPKFYHLNSTMVVILIYIRFNELSLRFFCCIYVSPSEFYCICHSGILEESILLIVGQPASYDAGIRGKPLGGRPPNPLSLVLTEGVRGSHRVAPMMPKGEAFRTAFPNFSSQIPLGIHVSVE